MEIQWVPKLICWTHGKGDGDMTFPGLVSKGKCFSEKVESTLIRTVKFMFVVYFNLPVF